LTFCFCRQLSQNNFSGSPWKSSDLPVTAGVSLPFPQNTCTPTKSRCSEVSRAFARAHELGNDFAGSDRTAVINKRAGGSD